jgi:two-component system response regulator RegA
VSDGASILLVDDDDVFRERLAEALRARGLSVRTASDGESALSLARDESPEVAFVDLRMPGLSGLDVVQALHAIDPDTRVVVLTGYGSVGTVVDAMKLGASDYLQKPVDVASIMGVVDGASTLSSLEPHDVADVSLARAEWEHLHRVLRDCAGNVSEAARRLKIHRRSLQRKLQKNPPP